MSEISSLVDEINSVETEQQARRVRLFYLLKGRKGYRRCVFASGHSWVNCWSLPARLDAAKYLNDLNNQITEVNEGDEP